MKISFKQGIGRRKAHEMVLALARHGLNPRLGRRHFATDAAAIKFIEQAGKPLGKIVEDLQKNFDPLVPCEAITMFDGYVSGSGVTLSAVDRATGEVVAQGSGDGSHITLSVCRSRFKQAVEQIHRATGNSIHPYEEVLLAIQAGFASIEAFLNEVAAAWKRANPDKSLDEGSWGRLSFDERLDAWPAKMTGKRLDKSGPSWQALQRLKAVRDDDATHPKNAASVTSLESVAALINDFRGLAAILLQLHILFDSDVPSEIIRASFRPDAVVER